MSEEMSSVDSVWQLIEIVRNNPDECNYTGGMSEEDIERAQSELGARFPASYRLFVAELGSCQAGSVEIKGVNRTPTGGDRLRGTVSATLDARDDERFPPGLLVIEYDGMGGIIALDSEGHGGEREYPVVAWDPGAEDRGGPERLAEDFGSYALQRCRLGLS
ncbi:SMI1/KNR4 family protein [Saccharopolyspora sp. NFXS83]|uniref:SMI1/KNR4 family protein n=1 Tax=Saccharopolyspora sp. NFXS83 TaxID=2993560 RepID=UPI00224A9A6F|nr:SMI1/KNR4 family protein [Saccharopolyspora sp. NFXS83]MCX2734249.1 SMI1/KNR4 family protein [Saccharopolyspora sp. NFXS83]